MSDTDDQTRIISREPPAAAQRLRVGGVSGCDADDISGREYSSNFSIGRDDACDITLGHELVSRRHAAIDLIDGVWHLRDLGSSNGTWVDGQAVTNMPLSLPATIELGLGGPQLHLADASVEADDRTRIVTRPAAPDAERSYTEIVHQALGDPPGGAGADHQAELVRRTAALVKSQGRGRRRALAAVVATVLVASLAVVGYQQRQIRIQRAELAEVRELAVALFYQTKTMQLRLAALDDTGRRDDVARLRRSIESSEERYDEMVARLRGDANLAREDRLILRVARELGECDANVPPEFAAEVKRYIAKWQSSGRLKSALARLRSKNYTPRILEVLEANRLPRQFAFVALQESNYRKDIVGKPTRWGIAKGMWQFIPATGEEFGLTIGPLKDEPVYDPEDERFDFYKATAAAGRFLKHIHEGEAQASGLLVMASYNWGQNIVRANIRKMPEDPSERNFWAFMNTFTLPEETRDYVFMIFSAAVIAEDPALFGFDFPPPLVQT